jgi:hypothetical protein
MHFYILYKGFFFLVVSKLQFQKGVNFLNLRYLNLFPDGLALILIFMF